MSSKSFDRNSTANWSNYQDKQLDVLSNIESSFRANIKEDKQLKSSLEGLYKSLDNLVNNPKVYKEGTDRAERLFGSMNSILERQEKESIRRIAAINSTMDKFNMSFESAARVYDEAAAKQKEAGDYFSKKVQEAFSYLGKLADSWSSMSNDLIVSSGMDGESVRKYRSDLANAVYELNKTTGYAINAQKAYSHMISDVSKVTGDLDAMREMTRPMLLAEETLPGNISSIAELFNKFYVKYNFSSKNMEGVLDKIRGNTAGNAATAEANLEAISELSTIISILSKGDSNRQEELMGEISDYVSKLEASGISHTGATKIIQDLYYGNVDSTTAMIMNRGGSSLSQGKQDVLSNNFNTVADDYLQGVYNIVDSLWDESAGKFEPYQLQKVLETYGLDNSALDIWSTMKFGNGVDLSNLLGDDASTMEQLTEDKYVSMTDKTHNFLSIISNKLGSLQEALGFGFSDIVQLLAVYAGFNNLRGHLSNLGLGGSSTGTRGLSSILGSYSGGGRSTTGLLGSLEMAGFNTSGGSLVGGKAAALGGLTIAGVAGGAMLGYDGIKGALDTDKSTGSRVLSGVEAAGGIAGAGLLGASALGLAATGPAGWIALAVGGAALLGKKLYDHAHAYEAAGKLVDKTYKQAKSTFNKEILNRKEYLSDIQYLLQDETSLEEARKDLINSGLLSEEDVAKARILNKEGLEALTQAYLEATDKFGDAGQELLDKYRLEDREAANATMESIQDWYRINKYVENDTNKDIMEQIVEQTAAALMELQDSGGSLTKKQQKFLDKYDEFVMEGKNSQGDYRKLLDIGDFSIVAGSIGGSRLSTLSNNMAKVIEPYYQTNQWGVQIGSEKSIITYGGGHSTDDILNYVLPITQAKTKEEAEEALLAAKAAGIRKEDYSEIGEFLDQHQDWGLSYSTGTNYVPEDQLALIHEGEAIVPKKYNPAVHDYPIREALSSVRQSLSESHVSNRESARSMNEVVSEMREIKEFLSYWKKDNEKKSRVEEMRSRYSSLSSASRRYYA